MADIKTSTLNGEFENVDGYLEKERYQVTFTTEFLRDIVGSRIEIVGIDIDYNKERDNITFKIRHI